MIGNLLKKRTQRNENDDDDDDEPEAVEMEEGEDDDGALDAKPLIFRSLQFKYNFEAGSESSIAFLKCLS